MRERKDRDRERKRERKRWSKRALDVKGRTKWGEK